MKKAIYTLICGVFGLTPVVPAIHSLAAPQPNILFILSDDQGWADVGWHGTEIKTPHLDSLAAAGARLEQFYVMPVCSPTRAALMTGRYPMRQGLQVGVVRPWAQYGLPLEERTLPQALREVGYTTAICGKWHLGHYQPAYLPTQRGFDHQYGHYNGALDYFTHIRDGGFDWHRDDRVCRDEGYSTLLIANEAVRLIRAQPKDKPLFLYVPFNAVHAPHQVPEKYKEPYASLKEPRRTYAGMVAAMDEAIGQILAALDEKEMRRNTLIVFSSDNGGPAPGRVTSNGPLRAGKGTLYEGGVRVCALATWEGHIKPGTVIQQLLHMVDWYPTLLKLAGASLEQKLPLDGRDVWPTLARNEPSPHDAILINAEPRRGAIRMGDWKLVLNGMKSSEDSENETVTYSPGSRNILRNPESIELFNLANDPYEQNNLASTHPEKVKELRTRYDLLARQAALPKSAPRKPDFKNPATWGEMVSAEVNRTDTVVHNASEFRQAISEAKPGTRILLAPGLYPGGYHFSQLRGETNQPIIIAAAAATQPPVIQGSSGGLQFSQPAFLELHDLVIRNVTVNGLNIDDGGSFDTPAHHVVLRRLRVSDSWTEGQPGWH